jgi:hypothetical protein
MMRFATVLLAMTIHSVHAGPVTTLDEARQVSDAVMQEIAQGKVKAGFDRLRVHTTAAPAEVDVAARHAEAGLKAPPMLERYGNSIGSEFIRDIRVGSSLVRYIYLHKFERNALRWRVDWYRAADDWRVVYFNFDDKVQELFGN